MLQEIGDDLCPECEYYDGPNAYVSREFYCKAKCGWLSYYNKISDCHLRKEAIEEEPI